MNKQKNEPVDEHEQFIGMKRLREQFPDLYKQAIQNDTDVIEFENQLRLWRRDIFEFNKRRTPDQPPKPSKIRKELMKLLKTLEADDYNVVDVGTELRLEYLKLRADVGEVYYNLQFTGTLLSIVEAKIDLAYIGQQ